MRTLAEVASDAADEIRSEDDVRRFLEYLAIEMDRDGEILVPGGYASGATDAEIEQDRRIASYVRSLLAKDVGK